jgi:hypothetical protein
MHCIGGRASPCRWWPCQCLALAATPVLGVSGHTYFWIRRLYLCMASTATPMLSVGSRACALRQWLYLPLASPASPILGVDDRASHLRRWPCLYLASAAVLASLTATIFGVGRRACTWRHAPFASAAMPMIGAGSRTTPWRQQRRLSLALTAEALPSYGDRTCAWRGRPPAYP